MPVFLIFQIYMINNINLIDKSILNSFSKIHKHDIKYEPRDDTKFIRVRYLLKN